MQELRTAPRQRRSQQSIDAILDAAERLIHEQGQVSFTAAELASGADMSIGRIYYWFPDIPSIVGALVERSVQRMINVLGDALNSQADMPTPVLVRRVVDAMCVHLDANPASLPLMLTGGAGSRGEPLYRSLVSLVSAVVIDRVPDIPPDEVELVSRTTVGITLGMLHRYPRAGGHKDLLRQELVFLLCAWLAARYPAADDPVWNNPQAPLQPSRAPRGGFVGTSPVWPALAPGAPSAGV